MNKLELSKKKMLVCLDILKSVRNLLLELALDNVQKVAEIKIGANNVEKNE